MMVCWCLRDSAVRQYGDVPCVNYFLNLQYLYVLILVCWCLGVIVLPQCLRVDESALVPVPHWCCVDVCATVVVWWCPCDSDRVLTSLVYWILIPAWWRCVIEMVWWMAGGGEGGRQGARDGKKYEVPLLPQEMHAMSCARSPTPASQNKWCQ